LRNHRGRRLAATVRALILAESTSESSLAQRTLQAGPGAADGLSRG